MRLLSFLLQESGSPSILWILFHFLTGTIIGWWILIVVGLVVLTPVFKFFGNVAAHRRYIRNEESKLANPQNADVRFGLARIFFRGKRYAKAEDKIREAIGIAEESPLYDEVPHRFDVLFGDILYRRKKFEEAEQSYLSSLKKKSDLGYGDVYLGLGRVALRKKDAGRALEWLLKSLEERSSYLETYYRIAQARAILGHTDELATIRKRFRETAANLPAFAGQKRFRWRLAFLTFPISRHLI